MNSQILKSFFITVFVVMLASAIIWVLLNKIDTSTNIETIPSPSPKQTSKLPEFKITALQTGENTRQIISCEKQVCRPLPDQQSDETPAVTDGVSWFYYQTVKDRNNIERLQLRRSWIDSDQNDLIIEQTDLVAPRGLFISPDNQKVAFWLDNTHRDNTGLTELWIYSSTDNGTKLVAENIKRKGVLTNPRWNRSSTHLFFLGETIVDNNKQNTVHVVSIQTPSLNVPFTNIDWDGKYDLVMGGAMDISSSGQALAYVERQWNKNILYVRQEGITTNQTKIRGQIPYVQWFADDTLIYVVQTKHTFTFWKLSNGTHKHIAKYQGIFQSARADAQGKYLVFNAKHSNTIQNTLALDIETGQIESQGKLPTIDGRTYLIHFEPKTKTKIAGAIDQIDDEVLVNFIDKYLSEIVQNEVKPQRLIFTDQPNTVFIDYTTNNQKRARLLLGIQDVVHVEWTIKARYQEQSGEWIRVQGGGLSEPKPLRLYEWEPEVNQWILKDDFNK